MATRSPAQVALLVGALGVVFGDIGTSPIYTVQTIFNPDDPHSVPATACTASSLTFWSVTIIVTIKYVLLVMRADNDGEGGILALITLIRRRGVPGGRRTKLALAALGIFGASLFCRRQHDHPSRCCPPSRGSRWSARGLKPQGAGP